MSGLDEIRRDLRAQEEVILARLAERARYLRNDSMYEPGSGFELRFEDPVPALEAHPPYPLEPNAVNLGAELRRRYAKPILGLVCRQGDCGRHAETARCDAACLVALSRRVHFGKFVAEVKFRAEPAAYSEIVRAGDERALLEKLRDEGTERHILARVRERVDGASAGAARGGLSGERAVRIFAEHIIPLTLQVEVEYLNARRLEV